MTLMKIPAISFFEFTIMAIHMFACIDTFKNLRMASDIMAESIGTDPVIIRKLLGQFKADDLIDVLGGTGGVSVKRILNGITFLDIYRAAECNPDEERFRFHDHPNQACPVGRDITKFIENE